jgi:hypothetical protein
MEGYSLAGNFQSWSNPSKGAALLTLKVSFSGIIPPLQYKIIEVYIFVDDRDKKQVFASIHGLRLMI